MFHQATSDSFQPATQMMQQPPTAHHPRPNPRPPQAIAHASELPLLLAVLRPTLADPGVAERAAQATAAARSAGAAAPAAAAGPSTPAPQQANPAAGSNAAGSRARRSAPTAARAAPPGSSGTAAAGAAMAGGSQAPSSGTPGSQKQPRPMLLVGHCNPDWPLPLTRMDQLELDRVKKGKNAALEKKSRLEGAVVAVAESVLVLAVKCWVEERQRRRQLQQQRRQQRQNGDSEEEAEREEEQLAEDGDAEGDMDDLPDLPAPVTAANLNLGGLSKATNLERPVLMEWGGMQRVPLWGEPTVLRQGGLGANSGAVAVMTMGLWLMARLLGPAAPGWPRAGREWTYLSECEGPGRIVGAEAGLLSRAGW